MRRVLALAAVVMLAACAVYRGPEQDNLAFTAPVTVDSALSLAAAQLQLHGYTVIAGLGGRPITRKSLHALFHQAERDELEPLSFLDLDRAIVNRVLEREKELRRSGPIAETILRDVGVVAARVA